MGSKQETEVERLLLENYETYYRLAYSYVRQEQDALDIVQESAYKAIRDCKTVRIRITWPPGCTASSSTRRWTRSASANARNCRTPLPEAVWEDSYGDVDLRGVLERLDDRSRTVVILRYFEDMKLEDVARTVGENLNTVKARLYRALKKLRLDLEACAYEASGKEKPR